MSLSLDSFCRRVETIVGMLPSCPCQGDSFETTGRRWLVVWAARHCWGRAYQTASYPEIARATGYRSHAGIVKVVSRGATFDEAEAMEAAAPFLASVRGVEDAADPLPYRSVIAAHCAIFPSAKPMKASLT